MQLPQEVKNILNKLSEAGYEGYVVGGCVRDLLLKKEPKDWDVTTNAKPKEIQKIFSDSVYENTFGTVGVKTPHQADPPSAGQSPPLARRNPLTAIKKGGGFGAGQAGSLDIIEVTPYRIEGKYTDKRHPDQVRFGETLEEDLSRRDFTVNAMALGVKSEIRNPKSETNSKFQILNSKFLLIDLFGGQEDLKNKIIRTVGKPEERFNEDSLRLLRAIRFATTLDFSLDDQTLLAIKEHAEWLRAISKERIRDEFIKIIESENAYEGILLLEETGILQYIIPELREGIGVGQNLHHIYTVWEHNTRALKYATEKKYSLEVRLGSLFHDIGKPRTKRGEGKYSTFYGHDVVGGRVTAGIMERLKFPKDLSEKIIKLVRYHLFYYNVGEVTESSVRRLLANVGPENIEDLIKVREADRIGSGRPKAVPYKLRHLKYIVDKVSHDPISVKMLKVDGNELMEELDIKPGPKVGLILNSLLAEVLDDPTKNTKDNLKQRVHELDKKTPEELRDALKRIDEAVEQEEKERMKKYYV